MLQLTHLSGFGANSGSSDTAQFLYDQIVRRSLTTGLQLCLDAGDSRCYNGTSQVWTDASGNGHNFERGIDASVGSDDPSWTGSIGSWSDSTYFAFDGTQFFSPEAFHTFADGWHKNNGVFTMLAIIYIPTMTQAQLIFSTRNGAVADAGVNFRVSSSGPLTCYKSSSTTTRDQPESVATVTQDSWNFLAVSFDEATTTMRMQINGTAETPTASASTDTDNITQPIVIGSRPDLNAGAMIQNGTRLAAFAAWNSALNATALANLYADAKTRIPSIP